jgi:hypothetical protein
MFEAHIQKSKNKYMLTQEPSVHVNSVSPANTVNTNAPSVLTYILPVVLYECETWSLNLWEEPADIRQLQHAVIQKLRKQSLFMLHPIREITHFMNWPYYSCPFHELGKKYEEAGNLTSNATYKSAQFMKWEISRMGCNIHKQS